MPAALLAVAAAVIGAASVTYVPPVDGSDRRPLPAARLHLVPGQPRHRLRHRARHAGRGPSAAGIVTFAGQVGGRALTSSIAHADGLRTTYAYLAGVAVHAGPVGRARAASSAPRWPSLHFGVRRGDVYLDPELLFGGGRLVARLVPLDGRRSTRAGRWLAA